MSPSKKPSKPKSTREPKSVPGRDKAAVRSSRISTAISKPEGTPAPRESGLQTNVLRVIALLVVIGITYYIFSIRDRIAEFERYGYMGVFVVALLANATVLIPAPGLAIISAMGSVFNPLGVGLAAGTGGAIGELSGYLAGFSGQAVIERTEIYNRIKPWVQKFGGWAILVLSAIPNPFFDAAGIAAGMVKMPLRTFLISVWIGQIIKMTFFAYAGQSSYQALENYFK
ncbi:MAG TPA: VTT domain-containing protein [Anaerolineales bacterium]|nr:VTT domain-containing protein [Anaerolineales bacterium]